MQVWSLGLEDPLEEGIAIHSSIHAWRITWTGEPGRLLSTESQSQTQLKQLSMDASTNENIVFASLIVYGNGSRRKSSPSKIIKCTMPIFSDEENEFQRG